MNEDFTSPVPEIPVENVREAAAYYEKCLGFTRDWGEEAIGQVSRGTCRLFLTDRAFREGNGNPLKPPVTLWLNLDNRKEVDELHAEWNNRGARIISPPESKPWHLHEFLAADRDGNLFRVFYDFAWELPDRGGRRP
jgi:uncharacterized glyoxalase superfamily protein PhnB